MAKDKKGSKAGYFGRKSKSNKLPNYHTITIIGEKHTFTDREVKLARSRYLTGKKQGAW